MKSYCIAIIVLLVCVSQVKGTLLEPKFRHYSTEHGLSHDGVLCIKEDSEGFIWLGTWDGINRYDGNNFKTYKARPGDNSFLKNNKIRDIIEDKIGYLWVKTYDRKVYRFDKAREEFLPVIKSNKGESLEHIFIDKVIPVSNGDVWLTTEDNGVLCVLDKGNGDIDVVNYNSEKSFFGNSNVNFIYEDQQHRVWFGTKNGLICLVKNGKKYVSYLAPKTRSYGSNLNFTKVSSNSNGKLFFSTSNGFLVEYNPEFKAFYAKKVVDADILDILVSKTGNVYLTARKQGLIIYNHIKSSFRYEHDGGNTYYWIYEDRTGNIWLEPEKAGVVLYKPSTQSFYPFVHNKEDNLPYVAKSRQGNDKSFNVFEDANNLLWVCLKGGGFGYYDKNANKLNYFYNNPEEKNKLFTNNIVTAYSDKRGVLWFCTRNGGINKVVFSPNNFEYKQLTKNPSNKFENEVRALFQDSDDKIWITNKLGGLSVYKGEKIEVVDENQNLGSIYCITEDRNKNIWIGTKGQGLLKLQPKNESRTKYKVSRYTNEPGDLTSLSNNQIYSVVEDQTGQLWIGTFGGGINLLIEERGRVKFKNINNSFKNYPKHTFNVIRHIIQGPDKNIWLATTDGILRFNPNENPDYSKFRPTVKIPGDKNSLGNNDVQYLYQSSDNEVWAGTFGGGLNRVINDPKTLNDELKFKVYTKEQGLPNDIILSLVEDNNKNLWIATENGVSRLDIKNELFRNYDTYDGLPRTGLSEAACFRSNKGEIYFGCTNGYISFYPDKIVNEQFPANIAFTGIQLYNKDIDIKEPSSPLKSSINYADNIILNYNQDVLTFEYSVLDYRVPNNVSYAYILEGYDKNWHFVKNQRKATYTKIPPGSYTFRVKTVNNYYFENSPEKSISIKVNNPWWLSGWALLCYIFLSIIFLEIARRIVFTMIRLKNKVVVEERMTELKMQFFTNISHELRTPLTLIVNPLLKLKKTESLSDKGIKYLEVANKNADRMIRFVNQLLDFRKIQTQNLKLRIEKVELIGFMSGLLGHFVDILEEKEIALKLSSSAEEIFVWCDRDKMDIVFFNIISNAIKFTPKGKKIFVKLEKREGKVSVQIIDEGIGINMDKIEDIFKLYYAGDNQQDKAFKGTGIGLAISKEIVSLHRGVIKASKNTDQGMTFTIELLEGNLHFDTNDLLDENKWSKPDAKQIIYDRSSLKVEETDKEQSKDQLPKLLLVEDNMELRSFMVDQFKDTYNIGEAENGKEGYLKAIELVPDAIISDVMMPEMDGIQMLEKIKNDVVTSHIPIILLTAKSTIEDQIKGLSYGADFYVTKPFHADYIKYLLENLLKSRQQVVANILDKPTVLKLEPSEVVITSKDEAFLRNVIQVVEEKMSDQEFNIETVANSMAMGRTTFYKKLKSLTNMTPVEFVRDIRLKRGRQLLATGELTVSEIAYQIGFNSSGYFSTCFKEKYNISPSDYLKNEHTG
ncbi:hybrid sensor histidine kinase/response regulator transcription factor [Pseudopedobacter saltans]|nr:hybrid sensor histidine kinase/response regulator transcription factor [Pseudopedobacter saltans]